MQSKACVTCSKIFYKTPNLSQKYWEEKRLYCSNRCKVLGKPSLKKGKLYPNIWKDNVAYGQLHLRVKRLYGKAKKCVTCGSEKNVQWANKSNKYIDANDFIELCASCHRTYDNKMNSRVVWNKGISMSEEQKEKLSNALKGRTAWNRKERIMIFCKCGCGNERMNVDSHGRWRNYLHGHNNGRINL